MPELPSFTNPPLAEVVLGAQLAQPWISGPALGSLWDDLRAEYPGPLSQQPAVQAIDERFDTVAMMQLQFGLPGVRDVLTSGDGERLVQIQADRVAYNWRKLTPEAAYPRYETIIAPFEELVERVLRRSPVGAPHDHQVTWAEVIYVNHIETAPQTDAHRFPEKILNLAAAPTVTAGIDSEDFSLARRFLLPNRVGRLYVEASSAVDGATGRKIMLLTLTARIAVAMVGNLRNALDLGHETIVQTFADVTSVDFQADWGRER